MKKAIIILSLAALALVGPAAAERWPLGPGNVPQRLGNNCYEFQNYGGSSYYHDGDDVLGAGGDPCYSVANGYLMLKSQSEPLYSGIVINYTNAQDKGWLYWHLTYSTIPYVVGDYIPEGARVGNIATWPVASFHHVHFTRSYYPGVLGWYDAVDNPIEFMVPPTDTQAPVFDEAETGQMFSFCENNADTRVDPANVYGNVDIIARISDRIVDTNWRLVPYEIDWWVNGAGGNIPETDFLTFTKACPPASTVETVVYKRSGQWFTQGDYNGREFYFIVTNTDGDAVVEDGDDAYALDSTKLPNGTYTLYVRAKDWAGNVVTQNMDFTVNNTTDINLKSFAAAGTPTGVKVTWEAEENGVKYNLYRREAGAKTPPSAHAGAPGDRLNGAPIAGKSPFTYKDVAVEEGVTYKYWLEAVDLSGRTTVYGPVGAKAGAGRPTAYALHGVAPNPVRGAAAFSFALPEAARVTITLYDLSGRKVGTVVDEKMEAGEHRVATTLALAPGVYVYRMNAGSFVAAKRLVVAR